MLQRFQIYLESDSVSTLDEIASELRLSRSTIIRQAVDQTVSELKKALLQTRTRVIDISEDPILKMAGLNKKNPVGATKKDIDSIYLQD